MPVERDPLDLVRALAELVRADGGRALVVGGYVRDRLLGRESKDLDVEVFGIEEARLPALLGSLGRVTAVGQAFPVLKLEGIDVALPRRESKTGPGHKGFAVRGDPRMRFDEAARRRDFTVNAIGWNPLTGDYLDPFGGRQDLAAGRLQVVDPPTFADDSLRVLRALQFVARFGLTMTAETLAICRTIRVDDLPAERLWGEMEKLLLAGRPSLGFAAARATGLTAQVFQETESLFTCPQDPEWHPEGDVWTHTLLVVDRAAEWNTDLPRAQRLAVMLGAVCHDFGKPATTAIIDGRIRSPGHEEAGVLPTSALLDRLNLWSVDGIDVRTQVLGLVANHLKPSAFDNAEPRVSDGAYRRLAQKVDLELLARVARADCNGRGAAFDCSGIERFLDRARSLGVEHRPPAPILLGRHLLELGMRPGPEMGSVLRAVYEQQLEGIVRTLNDAVTVARELLRTQLDSDRLSSGN